MAIIKAVNSRASLAHAINYITKHEKTEDRLIGGYNCNPKTAIDDMKETKIAWDKTEGRQYKHFIQSFPKDENISLDEANEIAKKLVESCPLFQGYEVCYATHMDREHVHTHIVVNSVSYEHGKKINYSNKQLQDMKDLSDTILVEHNKSICQKNEEITTFDMKTYKAIEKAVNGNYKSWIYDTMLAIDEAMHNSVNRNEFIQKMADNSYQVDWQDNRKYIVFIDENGNKVRDKKLANIFKVKISKEDLENEFSRNNEKQSNSTETGCRATDINFESVERYAGTTENRLPEFSGDEIIGAIQSKVRAVKERADRATESSRNNSEWISEKQRVIDHADEQHSRTVQQKPKRRDEGLYR